MDRLQKKCFVVSAGTHLLLALILFLNSAFSSSESKTSDITPLTFIPSMLLEKDIRGGGNPNVKPPPPSTPPPISLAPAKPQVAETKPAPEPVKTREVPEPEPAEVSLERKTRKPQISTKLVTRPTRTANKATSKTNSSSEQDQELVARRELASRIGRAVADLGQASAPVASIEDFGPGGGGPAYAGYAAYVQAIYLSAWVPPEEAATEAAVVKAKVTIAHDGTVTAHLISKRSGDRQVDSSVERVLERVDTIGRPFPEGMKDKERTYILKFDLTVKRGQA